MQGRRDPGSVRAFVLGVLAMWFGVFAPFAIYSAVRSLRRIRASGGEVGGGALAFAGLAGGLLGVAVILAGVLYWVLVA